MFGKRIDTDSMKSKCKERKKEYYPFINLREIKMTVFEINGNMAFLFDKFALTRIKVIFNFANKKDHTMSNSSIDEIFSSIEIIAMADISLECIFKCNDRRFLKFSSTFLKGLSKVDVCEH